MKNFGNSVFEFLKDLKPEFKLPKGISCLLPFENPEVIQINKKFYRKFFNDKGKRRMIIGINPGRFGSGITGISFTDPIKLENVLGIENSFSKRAELSSDFIYRVIDEFGGPEIFYQHFYVTAVCPIGFLKDGKNINYYDDTKLSENVTAFIVQAIKKQLEFGIDRAICYCLGEGENYKFLKKLNEHYHFFEQIIPLAHPRFIMQYRRKFINDFVQQYIVAIKGNKPKIEPLKNLVKS